MDGDGSVSLNAAERKRSNYCRSCPSIGEDGRCLSKHRQVDLESKCLVYIKIAHDGTGPSAAAAEAGFALMDTYKVSFVLLALLLDALGRRFRISASTAIRSQAVGGGLVVFLWSMLSACATTFDRCPPRLLLYAFRSFADDHLPEGKEEEGTSIRPAITTPAIRQQFLTLYCDLVHRAAIHNCFLTESLD